MVFLNRDDAARQLADVLADRDLRRPVVLAVPRGAVPMARVVADRLGADLDIVLVRKLRAPEQPELAIGAVDVDGVIVKEPYFANVPADYVEAEVRRQVELLRSRRTRYAQGRPPVDLRGRDLVVIDDGVATGASMVAALRAVRAHRPARVIAAIGVAPPSAVARLRSEADEVVCLHSPETFMAVGAFYQDFAEVTDEDVIAILDAHARARSGQQDRADRLAPGRSLLGE